MLTEIQQRVLELSRAERKGLIHLLVDSLEDTDDAIEGSWLTEAEERFGELVTGKSDPIPADEVFAALKEEPARLVAPRK